MQARRPGGVAFCMKQRRVGRDAGVFSRKLTVGRRRSKLGGMTRVWQTLGIVVLAFALVRPALADQAAVHYNEGLNLKRQGKTAEAIEEVKLAIAARKDYAAAWFTLGNLYRSQGEYDNALGAYQKTVALQPANADARANLGALYIRMKRVEEGIKELVSAISLDDTNYDARATLGMAYRQKGDYPKAIIHLRRATEIKPD